MFNNKKDYDEVVKYLKFKNLKIENKAVFLQMVEEEDILKVLDGAFDGKK